jgi:hypothetical protein
MSGCCTPVKAKNDENERVERCCAPPVAAKEAGAVQTQHCPACGQKGKMVDRITPKAMLNVSLLALQDTAYLFCPTAACDVVYFSTDGRQLFTTEKIRVPVHQKEPGDERVPVCYCFRHSPATIRSELLATGQSTVIEEISAGIKAGHCACEIRNPQGSCCLGNVRAVVTQVGQAIS